MTLQNKNFCRTRRICEMQRRPVSQQGKTRHSWVFFPAVLRLALSRSLYLRKDGKFQDTYKLITSSISLNDESSNRAPNLFSSSTGFSLRLPARFVCNKIVTFACGVALLIVLQTRRMKSSALSPSVSVAVHKKKCATRGEGVGPTRDGKYHNFSPFL